jgi:hypothetical protein
MRLKLITNNFLCIHISKDIFSLRKVEKSEDSTESTGNLEEGPGPHHTNRICYSSTTVSLEFVIIV